MPRQNVRKKKMRLSHSRFRKIAHPVQFGPQQCNNARCSSKGKRVLVRHFILGVYGLVLKSQRDAKSVCEGAPKVFR